MSEAGPPPVRRPDASVLRFQHRVLHALPGFRGGAMRVALRALDLGLRVAAGLLRRLADIALDLVQAPRLMRLGCLDPCRLLECLLGRVPGVGQLVVRLAASALRLGLDVTAGLLRRLADVVRDLVEAAGLVRVLRAGGGCGGGAVERESSGERRDACVDLHWWILRGNGAPPPNANLGAMFSSVPSEWWRA